jgi:hypothetical protein
MKLLSVTEAAAIYGCKRANMIFLINTGRVPAQRIGKQWAVTEGDVLALKAANEARVRSNARIPAV